MHSHAQLLFFNKCEDWPKRRNWREEKGLKKTGRRNSIKLLNMHSHAQLLFFDLASAKCEEQSEGWRWKAKFKLRITKVFAIAGLDIETIGSKTLIGFSSGLTLLIKRQMLSSTFKTLINIGIGVTELRISCHRKYRFVSGKFCGNTLRRHLTVKTKWLLQLQKLIF